MTNLTHNPDGSFTLSEVKKERYRVLVISEKTYENMDIVRNWDFYENKIVLESSSRRDTKHTDLQRNYFKKI